MNSIAQEWVTENLAWEEAKPRLSVLVPFLNDDPRDLLAALERETLGARGRVEVVLLDDGGEDDSLAAGVSDAVMAMTLPVRHVRLVRNEGRAKGRNRLAAHARGKWLLFIDSDMLPNSPDFLQRYLDLIDAEDPAVAFGGFTLPVQPAGREFALHWHMASRSDCLPAKARRRHPEKHVFTSNLLVRRDVFDSEHFDERFKGWGWEDVEWGIRVAERYPLLHIENSATHLGLDRAETLAIKYEQSAANFSRLVISHPDVVRRYPSHRVAKLLKWLPLRRVWRTVLKAFALADFAPTGPRAFSMRLYRAALYADVI